MTTLAVYVCQCAAPQLFARPSGQILCARCGLPILPKTPPEVRP